MSYRMIQESESKIQFVPERKDAMVSFFSLVMGVGATASGLYDLNQNIFEYWSMIISGAGISFIAGSFLLMQFHRNRPAKMFLDGEGGFLSILDRKGKSARIPLSRIRRVGYRFAGRGQYMVFLIKTDGGTMDLLARRSIRKVHDRVEALSRFLEKAKSDESYEPELPSSIEIRSVGEKTLYLWKERVTILNSFLISLFFGGLVLAVLGGFQQAEFPDSVNWIALSIYGLFLGYATFSIIHSLFVRNWIYLSADYFAWGRSYPNLRKISARVQSEQHRDSRPRPEVHLLEYSLDLNSGFSRYRVLNGESFDSLIAWREGRSSSGFRARRFFSGLPEISLFGLSHSEILRFQQILNERLNAKIGDGQS